jgi:hypothetical protein
METDQKEDTKTPEVKNVVFVIIALIAAIAVALWLTL